MILSFEKHYVERPNVSNPEGELVYFVDYFASDSVLEFMKEELRRQVQGIDSIGMNPEDMLYFSVVESGCHIE